MAESGATVRTEAGKSAGVIRSQVPGRALALMRLAYTQDSQPLFTAAAAGTDTGADTGTDTDTSVRVVPVTPAWWPQPATAAGKEV